MKKTEILSTIGHCIALGIHFLLSRQAIDLLPFFIFSLIPPIAFALCGYINKDRAFVIGQIGWLAVAINGIFYNL